MLPGPNEQKVLGRGEPPGVGGLATLDLLELKGKDATLHNLDQPIGELLVDGHRDQDGVRYLNQVLTLWQYSELCVVLHLVYLGEELTH